MRAPAVFAKIGSIALWTAVTVPILGLLFRILIWRRWVPNPADAYSASDIVEWLIWWLLLLVCGICLLTGAGLAAMRIDSRRLLAAGLLVPVGYWLAHPLVPTLLLW